MSNKKLEFFSNFFHELNFYQELKKILSNFTLKRFEAEKIQCSSISEIPLQTIFEK